MAQQHSQTQRVQTTTMDINRTTLITRPSENKMSHRTLYGTSSPDFHHDTRWFHTMTEPRSGAHEKSRLVWSGGDPFHS